MTTASDPTDPVPSGEGDERLIELKRDLEAFAHHSSGSLRIGMDEVRLILSALTLAGGREEAARSCVGAGGPSDLSAGREAVPSTAGELLPCPFCGRATAESYFARDGVRVACGCGASMTHYHSMGSDTNAIARRAWNSRAESFSQILNAMRAEEGDSITLLSDNPDFNGQPNSAVECCGAWTDWQDHRFTGDTLHAAVLAAYGARSLLSSHTLGKGEEGSSSVSLRAGADAPKETPHSAGQVTRNFVHHFYSELRLSEKRELFEKYGLPDGGWSLPDAVRWKAGLVHAKERGILDDMARDMGLLPPAESGANLSSEASARTETLDAPKDLPGLPTPSPCHPKEGGS